MLTDEQIKSAIDEMGIYFGADEPYDHIRMAYEWLDAQEKTKRVMSKSVMFNSELPTPRQMCIDWCGWFMCENAFAIAAYMHPEIKGEYPRFNISSKYTLPRIERINGMKGIIANDGYFGGKLWLKFHARKEADQ